jgi:sialidase-1
LLLRRSTDSGRTWGSQQVVRTGAGLNGFGDPSLLVDAETGRIFIFHAAGTHAGFFEAVAGLDPDDEVQHCDISYSDDDGLTWRHRRLTEQLKVRPNTIGPSNAETPPITGIFASAGQGVQIHAGPFRGRLVQQFVVLAGGAIMAASAYSDDHGENWTLGDLLGAGHGGTGPNENKVAALADGRHLLHSRATPRRLAAMSENGGHTWSLLLPVEDLPDPSDNGSLARFDGAPVLETSAAAPTESWLLATNNQDTALRRNTVLSLSTDDGKTWPAKLVLCPGSSAYSTAARLPDGNIGVLYERQGYREIVFCSVPAQQLSAQLGAPAANAPAGPRDGLVFHMELRSITPGRPAVWRNIGEFHTISSDRGDWGAQTWKEIGQGYSTDAQVIGSREAQDLNYGDITPAHKAGDILAFTGRTRNEGSGTATAVRLTGPGAEAFAPADLSPAGEVLYFTPSYTVTDADVERGSLTITFFVDGTYAGAEVRLGRIFGFDLATGAVQVAASCGL